jgi:hypothetical protein
MAIARAAIAASRSGTAPRPEKSKYRAMLPALTPDERCQLQRADIFIFFICDEEVRRGWLSNSKEKKPREVKKELRV